MHATLLLLLSALGSSLATHHPRRADHAHLARIDAEARALRELQERLMPITATTTVYVEETRTQTIWIRPTDQAVFGPGSAAGDSMSASETGSYVVVSASASETVSSAVVSASASLPSVSDAAVSSGSRISVESAVSSFITGSESLSAEATSTTGSISASVSASVAASDSESSKSSPPRPARSSASGPARSSPLATTSDAASLTQEAASSSPTSMSMSAASASQSDSIVSAGSAESSSLFPSESSSASELRETLWSASASVSASASGSASMTASASSFVVSMSSAAASSSAEPSSSAALSTSAPLSAESVPSPTASASTSSSTLLPLGPRLMNAYYPDWASWHLSPESVDWSKYDVLDFAFALPTAEGGLAFTQDDSSDLLRRLVASGHAAGKRVKLSIGGWTGSAFFSTITADDSLRATFVANIAQAYAAYNIDGIDIDWEYPGVGGATGNAVRNDDSANYLKLLQDLRRALPTGALLTTATQVFPFVNNEERAEDRAPLTDVSEYAKVIDWILIMNYDIWGSGDKNNQPGPNAPLQDFCGNSTQPLANAYVAVESWNRAGMPLDKITLGVPAYGYISKSDSTSLRQRRSSFPLPPHKREKSSRQNSVTVYNGNGDDSSGQVMFYELLNQGALVEDGTGNYNGAGGFTREWDACSKTPFLRSEASGQVITYDDAQSMSLKGQFAKNAKIRGCNVFSIDGDWYAGGFPLTDAVRSGMEL